MTVQPLTSSASRDHHLENGQDERWQESGYRQKVRIKGRLAALFVRFWSSGIRVTRVGWENDRKAHEDGRPVVYVCWHGSQVVPLAFFRGRGIIILTSLSRDGDIQDMSMSCLGFKTIRGSSSRGGARALLGLVRGLKQAGAAALTVDGPRGPYHVAKPGAVLLAQRAGAVVLPVGIAHSCCFHVNNWDKFEIPLPFSQSVLVVGEPFEIPPEWPVEKGQEMIEARISGCDETARQRLVQ